jgi:predicted SAM-dependent methyltransferase
MNLAKRLGTSAGFLAQAAWGLAAEDARRAVPHNRLILAARYIRGDGIEIGGLGRTLPIPFGARVKYLDRYDREGLFTNFPELARKKKIVEPDIVDDGETMATVQDGSQDFLIANHVVEHFQNPIRFFHNAVRILKPGGILFMALPEKTKTFDRDRPITPFEHLVADYENGPERSRREHYREYVRLADNHNGRPAWRTEAEYEALVAKLMAEDYSIHFHVWDMPAMQDLLQGLRSKYALPIETKAMLASGDEVVLILEKSR